MKNKLINKKVMNPKMKKVLKIIGATLMSIDLLLGLCVTINSFQEMNNGGTANVFGYAPISVTDNGMENVTEKGDLLWVKLISFDSDNNPSQVFVSGQTKVTFFYDINIGGKKELITRYYVGTLGDYFLFEGDEEVTYSVKSERIKGVYEGNKIPKLGYIYDYLRSSNGYLVVFLIPVSLLFLYALYRLVLVATIIKKEKREKEIISTGQLSHGDQKLLEEKIREQILKEIADSKSEKEKKDE